MRGHGWNGTTMHVDATGREPGNLKFGTDTFDSATFTVLADNFVAMNIGFKNTYNLGGTPQLLDRALAALIGGDKSAFYRCGFESLQDTLCDYHGRH
ncbi:putative pectinesterase 29 [Acorus gramineus]|uniref:pectinesterase n=1 Tax=Acorus gramineus TaxID=55184 RepID=A0AAV9BRU9_ACOGR|nr:putative pectinesterase 29 [Acorus gramineus]